MDDRFDRLFDDLPELPEKDASLINPWQRPLTYLAWGIFLTTVTFNFLQLDQLLPPVGILLLYLGFRALRRENGGFRAAYVMAVLRVVTLFVGYALRAAPVFSSELARLLTVPVLLIQVAQLAALRAGLARVFDRTGAPRRLGGVNWLLVFNLIIALGALLGVGDIGPLGLVMIAGYVAVIVAVARLPRSLGDAGCALRNAPVKLSDGVLSAVMLGSLLAVTLTCWLTGNTLAIPKAQPFTATENDALSEKLPAEILEIMTEEEIALFEEAENIQFTWSEGDAGMNRLTDLRLCTVTAQLPQARLLILHYFHWPVGGPRWGDSLTTWQSSSLTRIGTPAGGVVYEREGRSYRSAFADLAWGARTVQGVFTSTDPYVWADVYVPLGARNTRGYLLYTVSAGAEQWINYNCQLQYYHRTLPEAFAHPGSPSDVQFSGDFDHGNRAIFLTLFTAWCEEDPFDGTLTTIEPKM